MEDKKCLTCGKPLTQKENEHIFHFKRRKYCDLHCFYYRPIVQVKWTCQNCGIEKMVAPAFARERETCSHKCSVELFNKRYPKTQKLVGVKYGYILRPVLATVMLFCVATVSATEVTLTYTISQKSAGRSLVSSAPKSKQEESFAGGLKLKPLEGQNIAVSDNSRGGKIKTGKDTSNDTGRKIARINPSKNDNAGSDIVPVQKNLTEQGEKTRQVVMKIAEQMYSGQDLIAFDNLIKQESGYRYDALNSIGAGGLPQALPYTKMGCELTEADVPCQVDWMADYIERRYGSPSKAWRFWLSEVPINGQKVGHWY